MIFKDRFDAAKKLAPRLKNYKNTPDTYILAIPRGSLQMGYELARRLKIPLDIVVTKKVPAPGNQEYAIGSIGPDGGTMLNASEIARYGITEGYIEGVKKQLLDLILKRYKDYRGEEKPPSFKDKTVILIDDGIATGFTIKAAIAYLRRDGVKKIVVAVPVAAPDSAAEIRELTDEFVCLSEPPFFAAVAQFYQDFPQVADEDAIAYLQKRL